MRSEVLEADSRTTRRPQRQWSGRTLWGRVIILAAVLVGAGGLACNDEQEDGDVGAADISADTGDSPTADTNDAEPSARFDPLQHFDEAFGAVPDCDVPLLVFVNAELEPPGVELAEKTFQPWHFHFTCRAGIGTEDLAIVTLEPSTSAVVDCTGVDCMPDGYWVLSREECDAIVIGIDQMVEIASGNLGSDIVAVALYKPLLPETHPEAGIYYYLFGGHGIEATVNAETGELDTEE